MKDREVKMTVSTTKACFENDINKVWETVTDLKNYTWRSDLSSVEILGENQFIEHDKNGYQTTFTITCWEPLERWEFDMDSGNMSGHWVGVFTRAGENTEIEFTESVEAKKLIMKPFVKAYLKKQQEQYISDLRRALSGK